MDEKRKAYLKQYKKHYKAKRVNLTLSSDEYRDFLTQAKNTKITTYVKRLALASLHSQTMIPEHLETELKTLLFAIRNIANNVNQIAHYSNLVRTVSTANENNLLQHIKQLEKAVEEYTKGQITKATHKENTHDN
jgi:hypothetical protein